MGTRVTFHPRRCCVGLPSAKVWRGDPDAIERHRGEAEVVNLEFRLLSASEKQELITFLNSL